jgi:hypothetical protein
MIYTSDVVGGEKVYTYHNTTCRTKTAAAKLIMEDIILKRKLRKKSDIEFIYSLSCHRWIQ